MERTPIRRTIRFAAGTTGLAVVCAVGMVGYKLLENQWDGDAEGQNLEQQFNEALNDTPVGEVDDVAQSAGEQLNEVPIVGKTDDMLQTTFDRPKSEAEACLRVEDDLRVAASFEPQYALSQQVAAQIALARSQGEVLGLLDGFLDANGIELHLNTVTRPANMRAIDWAGTGVDTGEINAAPFDDTAPDSLTILKHYAAGTAIGLGYFSQDFNDTVLDYVILAGDVRHDASATAHEGLLRKGIVIEIDGDADIQTVAGRTVHEDTHAAQYYLSATLGLPNLRSVIQPYETIVPANFSYAESGGQPITDISISHPEYFSDGPLRVFARPYGATNLYEHGATAVPAMLVGHGIVGTDSPSWRSLYQQTQASWLTCFEVMMPGFTNATIEHQASLGRIDNMQVLEPYMNQSPHGIADLIQA